MKRKYVLLIAVLLLPWFSHASPVTINRSGNNLRVVFALGAWQLGTETLSTGSTTTTFQTIEMLADEDEYGIWADEGYPELPQLTLYLNVPKTAIACHVSVLSDSTSQGFLAKKILPHYDVEENMEPTAVPNRAYYSGNEAPLTAAYEVSEVYEVMGNKAVSLTIFPFVYSPAQNILKVLNRATFVLSFDLDNASTPQSVNMTEARDSYLKSYFSNYTSVVPKGDIKKGNYLIVTHKDFKDALTAFAAYKNTLGYSTTIVTTEETGPTAEEINAYIDNLPVSQRPTFILLAGDIDRIPESGGERDFEAEKNPLTDQGYRKHTDERRIYGDYFVGRWPISTREEVVSLINRTIAMERKYATMDHQALLIRGYDSHGWVKKSREKGLEKAVKKGFSPQGYGVTRFYEGSKSFFELKSLVEGNDKFLVMVFCGHGNPWGWYYEESSPLEPLSFCTAQIHPTLWGFSCQTGYYSGISNLATSICRKNGPISYFGSSVSILSVRNRYLTTSVMGYGLGEMEQLGPMIHKGMDRYRKLLGSRINAKTSDVYMKSFNFMGDPSFVREGIGDIPINIMFDGEVCLVTGISIEFNAESDISTNNTFVIEDGASISFHAGEKVILSPGFKIEKGGKLCINVK